MLQLQDAEKTVDVAGGSSLNDDSGDRQTVPDVCCDPVFIDFFIQLSAQTLQQSLSGHFASGFKGWVPVGPENS